jgi:hypothetical protein
VAQIEASEAASPKAPLRLVAALEEKMEGLAGQQVRTKPAFFSSFGLGIRLYRSHNSACHSALRCILSIHFLHVLRCRAGMWVDCSGSHPNLCFHRPQSAEGQGP